MRARLAIVLGWPFVSLGVYACSGDDGASLSSSGSPGGPSGQDAGADVNALPPDDGGGGSDVHVAQDTGANDGGTGTALPFACAALTSAPQPSACPAPSGQAGMVSFCYRAEWPGVTSVDVYGGFGQASDWTAPFLTLTGDGTGTFTGTTALANSATPYPYLFRVHGSADGLVKDGQYLLDQENPQFVPPPPNAPLKRSVSAVSAPQPTSTTIHHLRGKVVYAGAAQPCFSIDLEAGELRKDGGAVISEHTTANFAESAADGTFDFSVAPGPFGITIRFPFALSADAGYPDPNATPSVGTTRTGVDVAAVDVTLDPAEVNYPLADYAKLAPTGGTANLPVTFTVSVIPGSASASIAVIGTNIAGNDPLYWSAFGTSTSVGPWDGTFGGAAGQAKLGTTYYWGAWQKSAPGAAGTVWTMESLLFPIVFN